MNFRHFEPKQRMRKSKCATDRSQFKNYTYGLLKCTNFIFLSYFSFFFQFSLQILSKFFCDFYPQFFLKFFFKNFSVFLQFSFTFLLFVPLMGVYVRILKICHRQRISWLFECCWHTRNLWLALLQEGQRNSKLFLYILGKKFLRKVGADFALHFRKCVAWSEQALSISVRMFKLLSRYHDAKAQVVKDDDPAHLHLSITKLQMTSPH